MISLAHSFTQQPRLEPLKSDRRSRKGAEPDRPPTLSEDKAHFEQLLEGLKSRFSDSVDEAYLIESEVNQHTADLYRKAHYDSLTHLPNRAYFHSLLDQLVQRASQQEIFFSLLFLDLDGFKTVNDTLGHPVGDELLRYVSGRLVSSVREQDIVSRLGGDEFIVLLADVASREEVEVVCQRIIQEISRPYWFDGVEVATSTSIGVAQFPQDAKLASELIEQADEALYVAKSNGKNRFRFYEDIRPSMTFHQVQQTFEQAIETEQFRMSVQPQVDLKQNRLVGGYLSVEWEKEDGRFEPFECWQGVLKSSGYEETFALWLLDTACFYLKQWSQHHAELVVTVPLLEALWQKKDCLACLQSRLKAYGVTASQLQLAVPMASFEAMDPTWMATWIDLSQAGFQITLTGLGACPLNLPVLSALNIQEFKFDQAWLKAQLASPSGQKWVQALIQMGQSLDACMIATGVETEAQVSALKQWGCSLGQGPYWAEPMAAARFESQLV